MNYIHKFPIFYTINYINKREKECPPCFQQEQWLSILKAVQKEKANQARALGVNLVNSHDNATEKDQELLSVVCIWDGTHKSADFFAMNKMLYHLVDVARLHNKRSLHFIQHSRQKVMEHFIVSVYLWKDIKPPHTKSYKFSRIKQAFSCVFTSH